MTVATNELAVKPTATMRTLAAAWFALFGFLAVAALFFPLFLSRGVRFPAVLLYLVLPALAGAVAGFLWGGPIADPARDYGTSLLRGLGVTVAAFAIFAALFALTLPFTERGWSLSQSGGLFVTTLLFGFLMAGPIALFAGLLASVTLHALARRSVWISRQPG